MTTWILEAKLRPPASPPDHLARGWAGRLGALPAVTLLEGGPGTGKTVALADLAAARAADGALTLWYALDAGDAEPATFFHYLAAGLRRHVPAAADELLALLREGKLDPRLLWQAFLQAVATYDVPGLTIALDDVQHLLAAPALVEALAQLPASLPPAVRVVLASRRPIPALARLRARGDLKRLGPAELAFAPAEVAAYLAARASGAVPPAWRERAAALEGWPLGLALIEAGLDAADLDEEALDAYVAAEVYGAQPPERQAFMLRAAMLPVVTAAAYLAAFGADEAPGHMAALEAEHLVARLPEAGAWRFPGWLASFLAREADRTVSATEQAARHRAVAAHALAAGHAEVALAHALAAGDVPGALAAAARAFPVMRHDGRVAALTRQLAAFPAAARGGEPFLALWAGHLGSLAGDQAGAIAAYEQARAGFRAASDPAGELAALVRLATLAGRTGDYVAYGRHVLQALGLVPAGNAADVADLHLARALVADARGDHGLMRSCNEEALAVPVGGDLEVAVSHVYAHLNLYTAAFQADDWAGAEGHAEAARGVAAAFGLAPPGIYAAFLVAHVRLVAGDVRAAGEAIAAIPAWWPELLAWPMAGVARTVLGAWHGARGEADEAERELAAALATFEGVQYADGRKLVLAERARQALRAGRGASVAGIVADAGLPADPASWNAYDLELALVAAEAGARELAAPVAAGLEALGAHSRAAVARGLHASSGDPPTPPLRGAPPVEGGAVDLLARDARGRPGGPATPHLVASERSVPPRSTGGGGRQAGGGWTTEALVLDAFGPFAVRRGGTLLTDWPRRKAKVMLAALVLNPRGMRSFDLAELLGDGDAASGAGTLKVAARALRKALEPDLAANAPSAYVRTTPDGYALDWDRVAGCDVRDFDAALARNDLAAALAWYRGDLFDEPVLRETFEADRDAYRARALAAAIALANQAPDEAAWRRAVAIDPCDEPAVLGLMAHLHAAGRTEHARQAYWDCRKELKRRLDAPPGQALEALARQLAG